MVQFKEKSWQAFIWKAPFYMTEKSRIAEIKKITSWDTAWMCVCVCVCVCVYTLTPVGFFRLHDVFDIREKFGSTIFCCEYSVSFCQVPSSLFLNLSYFTSKDENSSHRLLERKRYDIMCYPSKRWYILI